MAASMLRSIRMWNSAKLGANLLYFRAISVKNFHLANRLADSFNVQDNDDFKERVLDSTVPVIVDFHATWCGPCKILGPRLEVVLSEYKDKVHLAKVDVDQNTDLAFEYDVSAVPVVIGIKAGKEVNKFIGLKDEDEIKSFIDKVVGS